jgi:hypothetical protein
MYKIASVRLFRICFNHYDVAVLGFDAVQTRSYIPAFRRKILPPSSELYNSFETLNVLGA